MYKRQTYTLADADSITQVIYNLMDNAVKFCQQGGTLGLKIQPEDKKIFVSVSNTGLTIPENELSRIFDRFHKTDKSRSIDRDGVGLGLYIVKTIICSHGEDISVTSRDGLTAVSYTHLFPGADTARADQLHIRRFQHCVAGEHPGGNAHKFVHANCAHGVTSLSQCNPP